MYRRSNILCVVLAAIAAPAFASGDLDPGFGSGGKASIDLGGANEHANALARDASGNLYLAGGSDANGGADFAVLKLDANGDPVAGFGNNGKAIIDAGGADGANAIALDASGNIFVAGGSGVSGSGEMTLLKLDATGHLASGFASGGKFTLDLGGFETAVAIVLDGSGGMYLVGESGTVDGGAIVAKLDASGHLVSGYGDNGVATIPMGAQAVSTAKLDVSGRLVVSGFDSFGPFGGGEIVVAKVDASGHRVDTFGSSGVAYVYIDAGTFTTTTSPGGLALDGAGNIYLGGYTDAALNFTADLVAIKLDANGALVSGFGDGGVVLLDRADSEDYASAIALDSAGNVYLAGSISTNGDADFAVVELDAAGHLVAGFGDAGIKTVDFGDDAYAYGIVLAPDGHLYLGGGTYTDSSSNFAAAALVIDSLDAIFASGFDPAM